jgi:DNA-binding SARP family transcriptional activator
MSAANLVNWTLAPSIAVTADGRVIAVNEACERLTGQPAEALLGRSCSDVVMATDAAGGRVCRTEGCPTLASLAVGQAVALPWCDWIRHDGRRTPISATVLVIPRTERADHAAAVIMVHVADRGAALKASMPATTTEDPPVRVQLLGKAACWRGDACQPVRRRGVLELLAILALAGDAGVPRTRISNTLWPDAPPGNGRTHLRVLLHSLLQMLGPDVVESPPHTSMQGEMVRLGGHVWTDIAEFAARAIPRPAATHARPGTAADGQARLAEIDELLQLYRGDLDEAGEFGMWVTPHRERLRTRALGLLAEAAPLAAYLGRADRAVAYCLRAVELDPLHEGFRVALITAYGRLGQRSAAAAQYRTYRRILEEELSIQPSLVVERALREAV